MKTTTGAPTSVYQRFQESVERYPDKPFLHIPRQATKSYANGPVDFTYSQMSEEVEELRKRYHNCSYGAGSRVALMLENRADFFQHFFALNSLGVCVVPVNAEFVIDEITYLLDNSDVSLVIHLPLFSEKLRQSLQAIERTIDTCIVSGIENLPEAPALSNMELRTGVKADATILYTSGTTGKPKGCVLSNEFFFCVGDWYANIGGYCQLDAEVERMITPLPVFHTNALIWSMMAMIQKGGCLIQLDRFHSSTWWETVRESKATCLHYLGVMPAMLLSLPETESDNNEQIKFGLGAGVEPDLHARFEERFGFPLIEGWAMTETGSGVCFMTDSDPRHVGKRCMGKVQDTMEFIIVDEHKNEVATGEVGELLVRRKGSEPGFGFFTEYYKNKEATREAWSGGWFHTGDAVKQDDHGSVFFVERIKNIIRRSGENIAAAEVETVLIDHNYVVNCAVAPVADEIRGEEVAACIVLSENIDSSEEVASELVNYCLSKLSYFKAPGYILFVKELPVTSTQKIQRGQLRQLVTDAMAAKQYCDCRAMKKSKK